MMGIKADCKFNERGAWCKNKNVKRSLLGIGARCCSEYPYKSGECKFKEEFERPEINIKGTKI